jgi:hypothetical protein
MSAHTPGPWDWDGKFTVTIPHRDGHAAFRTNPEDAQVIVAAPELLNVAHAAWHLCQSLLADRYGATDDVIREVSDALQAAIAKAERRIG